MNMDNNDYLPSYFNAAEKWPGKIHEPLDQGNCAASWAFSTAGELQDMLHVVHYSTRGSQKVLLLICGNLY